MNNQEIEKRFERLEEAVFGGEKEATRKVIPPEKKTLPEEMIFLRDGGFFATPKTAKEAQKKLEDVGYICKLSRVEVALYRIFKKKWLRKVSKVEDGREVVAYVW